MTYFTNEDICSWSKNKEGVLEYLLLQKLDTYVVVVSTLNNKTYYQKIEGRDFFTFNMKEPSNPTFIEGLVSDFLKCCPEDIFGNKFYCQYDI